ncbi:MAG: hypothetical protein KY463_11600 [Actinobacteria bacterium]|nr:hypothetical protein [Actinomycetota bacterium]
MPPRRSDLLLAVGGAVAGAAITAIWAGGARDVATAAALGAALGASRRYPRATWLAAVVILLLSAAQARLPGDHAFTTYLLLAAHAFCAGRWDPHWRGLAGPAALVCASVAAMTAADESRVASVFIPIAAWGAARALRERELIAAELTARARELEEEREAHAALSVRYERARIASELHDIVAHAISIMVVQAGAGQRLAHDPQLTAETFKAIAGAALQAEQDMGRLVALLGDERAIGPAPDLALIEELVARASGSGLDVALNLQGERAGLPVEVGQTAYRVVQEGLTNALRYATGSAVRVLVRGDRQALLVEVTNDPADNERALAGTGTGTGLQGLRDRVAACGGTLQAGPLTDGGWQLRARLPRRTAAGAVAPAAVSPRTTR